MRTLGFLFVLFAIGPLQSDAITITNTSSTCNSTVSDITSTIDFSFALRQDPAGIAFYTSITPAWSISPGCEDAYGNSHIWYLGIYRQSIKIIFSQPIDYFGFAWSTPTADDVVRFFNGTTQVGLYTGSSILNLSPNGTSYVNFFADAGEQFTSIHLQNLGYTTCCFETDNHSYRVVGANAVAEVAEPSSLGLLAVPAILIVVRRKLCPQECELDKK